MNLLRILLSLILFVPQSLFAAVVVAPVRTTSINTGLGAIGAGISAAAPASGLSGAAQLTQGPVLSYPTTFRGMSATYKVAEKNYLTAIEKVMAIPADQRTFANTVKPLSEADARFQEDIVGASFMTDVSPDPKVRRMGDAIDRRTSRLGIGLAARQDIFQAYKDVAAKGEQLFGEDKKLLEETIRGYERSGMGLPQAQRDRLNAIRQKLSDLSQAFSKNLREVNDKLEVDPSQLAGLPQSYIDGLEKTPDGKVKVGLDYPSYGPFMDLAKDSELRRQLYMKYGSRAAGQNLPILTEVLKLRQELAKVLGYQSYAHYAIEDRMAKTPDRVQSFLTRLKDLLQGGAKAEEARMVEEKRRDDPAAASVPAWDRAFYATRLQKRLYDLDDEEVRQYFPADTVVEGTLQVYQNLLGLRFNEVPAQGWSPDVRLFRIEDAATGRQIGHFFLDLYPRPGKYNHMAAFSLLQGRELPDGSYRQPVSAMVGNFTKATPGQPSLLLHSEVETFFHEFGHLMHQTLTQARYTEFSGSRVARDFVEAPSQMLENFVWQPAVLARLSGHWKDTSQKLPKALLDKMLAAKNFNRAKAELGQVALATLDLVYNVMTGPVDPMTVMARIWQDLGLPAPVPGTAFPANFGHLMGYAAGYYGYLWSRVYAQDIFSRFEAEGIDNPAVGRSYRKEILQTGSSRDEAESLKAFLGREPNEEAFLKYLGLEPEKPSPALVEEKMAEPAKTAIKEALTSMKDRLLPLAGKVQLRFESHYNPRNPLVLVQAANGRRSMFYLHEARELLWKARFSWRDPRTWLPRLAADPDTMDLGRQVEAAVSFAELLAR
ncbi:MAG: Zn-dependent oligopeptidase [Elusimicrobia bacterium]|nr:Zn-dependent oligopeptidase [Elusimicrobiota bacterium]